MVDNLEEGDMQSRRGRQSNWGIRKIQVKDIKPSIEEGSYSYSDKPLFSSIARRQDLSQNLARSPLNPPSQNIEIWAMKIVGQVREAKSTRTKVSMTMDN